MPDYYIVHTHIRNLTVRVWRGLLRKASKYKWAHHRAELCESVLSGTTRGHVSVITTRGRGGRGRRLDIHAVEGLVGRNLEPRRPWRGDRILGVGVNLSRGGCDDGEREGDGRRKKNIIKRSSFRVKPLLQRIFDCLFS